MEHSTEPTISVSLTVFLWLFILMVATRGLMLVQVS